MPMLMDWWTRLEAAPRFGGPRRHVHAQLGGDLATFLERQGILRQGRIANTFPCAGSRGDGCSRSVIEIDGEYQLVCGSRPAQCADIVVSASDVALLSLDMAALCRRVGSALGIQAQPEAVHGIAGIHRIGSFAAAPATRHPAFLVIRFSAKHYAEALGALASRQNGRPFVVLLPTARFLTDGIERDARTVGAAIVVLSDVLDMAADGFTAAADPRRFLDSLGRTESRGQPAATMGVVARALVCDGALPPDWHDLDDRQYAELVADASRYDVFADQRRGTVLKAGTVAGDKVPASHFSTILAAVTSRSHYDPNVTGPDLAQGKQIFQRARALFDSGSGRASWRIFPTIRHEEGHAVYAFRPQPGVTFAFVFLPDS